MFKVCCRIKGSLHSYAYARKSTKYAKNPLYKNVLLNEIVIKSFWKNFFSKWEAGIIDVIIDPGFGFGKTLEHNYQNLKRIYHFFKELDCPILVGVV